MARWAQPRRGGLQPREWRTRGASCDPNGATLTYCVVRSRLWGDWGGYAPTDLTHGSIAQGSATHS
eukprot:1128979-Prymnesium_polylepis.1